LLLLPSNPRNLFPIEMYFEKLRLNLLPTLVHILFLFLLLFAALIFMTSNIIVKNELDHCLRKDHFKSNEFPECFSSIVSCSRIGRHIDLAISQGLISESIRQFFPIAGLSGFFPGAEIIVLLRIARARPPLWQVQPMTFAR